MPVLVPVDTSTHGPYPPMATLIPRPHWQQGPPGAPQPPMMMMDPGAPIGGPPIMGPIGSPVMMGHPMMGTLPGPPQIIQGPPMGHPMGSMVRPVPMNTMTMAPGMNGMGGMNSMTMARPVVNQESPVPSGFGNHIPLARCRVLYLGSAVPTETAEGLEAVQQPLRERYPFDSDGDVPGIDTWLTVFSSGLAMQYVSDMATVTWFPISSMHVSAAVKCCCVVNATTGERIPRFEGLDSEAAQKSEDPPMFTCIMRRTKGVKVLECHAFITKSTQAAMALVQSCMHAFDHKEGWNEDAPPPLDELRRTGSTVHLVAAESKPKEEDAAPAAPPEFYQRPPQQGYYYASRKELVRNYNVAGGRNRRVQAPQGPPRGPPGPPMEMRGPPMEMRGPPMEMRGPPMEMRGPPMEMRGPPMEMRGPPMALAPPGAPILTMPPPPQGYFNDWDRHGNVPVMMYPVPEMMGPGPIVYEKEGSRNSKKGKKSKKNKKNAKSPTRAKSPKHRVKSPKRHAYREVGPHYYSSSESDSDYIYTEDMRRQPTMTRGRYEEPRYHRSRRDDYQMRYNEAPMNAYREWREPVYGHYRGDDREPSDLMFYGNRYQQDDPQYAAYLPRPVGKNQRIHRGEYVEYDSHYNPDVILREGDNVRRPRSPPGSPGRDRLRRQDSNEPYPRQEYEFGKSIAEERRAVGDHMDYPDPYKMNDYRNHIDKEESEYGYRARIDRDDKRQEGEFTMERGLGYLP